MTLAHESEDQAEQLCEDGDQIREQEERGIVGGRQPGVIMDGIVDGLVQATRVHPPDNVEERGTQQVTERIMLAAQICFLVFK